jgi:hypothetical protein
MPACLMTSVDRRKQKGGGSEKGGVTYIYITGHISRSPPARVHAATLDYLAHAHALLEARALKVS